MNNNNLRTEVPAWTSALDGVSVVIPAYDEENGIELTVRSLCDVFERARHAGARVIEHPHNVGYGRWLKDGISAAGYANVNGLTESACRIDIFNAANVNVVGTDNYDITGA